MKRLFDIFMSFSSIIILFIPMLFIGIVIKLNSKGPIFFKQQRVGTNGEYFWIYKFRTMHTDTPNVSTEALGNPTNYITETGYFLRKSSLDELPQLVNILKGDMSFVGPRPALYNQYELIKLRKQYGINSIRPGLTGYAQIMGRDYITDYEKVEYDNYYLKNYSFMFDLEIIFKTIFSVLKGDGIKLK